MFHVEQIPIIMDYTNPQLLIDRSAVEPGIITWRSPSNIALVKYWGKHGQQLPRNPSVSFTLNNAVTDTMIEYAPKDQPSEGISLDFLFHGEQNEAFAAKIEAYLTSILPAFPFLKQLKLSIKSGNSFPHSTGIASSASAMSAIALGICTLEHRLFDTLGDDLAFDTKASYFSRLGSGSACRSIFSRAAVWGKSSIVADSHDEYAVGIESELHPVFNSFHDDILIVSKSEKKVSSRAGHALMEGNPYAPARYQQAINHLEQIMPTLRNGDLETFGNIVEKEALALHALMMASNPPYVLMRPNTLEMIERIQDYRAETKHPIYFTLDAGPNIHLLYPESIIHDARPFIEEQLVPLCQDQTYLPDWVGEGPEEM